MTLKDYLWWSVESLAVVMALVVAGYVCYVGVAWCRYRRVFHTRLTDRTDALLDSVMPAFEVATRQRVGVAAPAQIAFSVACDTNIQQSPIVRAVFRARAFALGGPAGKEKPQSLGLVDQAKAWGWGILAEDPGREIVFGAVTEPWTANPVFRALAPRDFAQFDQPGYVKIAWMLRVDPIDHANSILSTETHVATTDFVSRAKFRRYWSWASPGMFLIRWVSLRSARDRAQRRFRIPISNPAAPQA